MLCYLFLSQAKLRYQIYFSLVELKYQFTFACDLIDLYIKLRKI